MFAMKRFAHAITCVLNCTVSKQFSPQNIHERRKEQLRKLKQPRLIGLDISLQSIRLGSSSCSRKASREWLDTL